MKRVPWENLDAILDQQTRELKDRALAHREAQRFTYEAWRDGYLAERRRSWLSRLVNKIF